MLSVLVETVQKSTAAGWVMVMIRTAGLVSSFSRCSETRSPVRLATQLSP